MALAEIYGGSRSDAARIGGVGLQIVHDWGVRFNAEGPDGLLNGKAPGARSMLDASQRQALRRIAEDGPIPVVHGVVDEIAAKEARGKPIEIWFQDEARIGQKNKIARR